MQKKYINVFLSFYTLPSFFTFLFWWIKNGRNRAEADFFPLLFKKIELFSDWKITVFLSELNIPWKFIGSKWDGILPPSFYGPSTYGFMKFFNSLPFVSPYSITHKTSYLPDIYQHLIFLFLAIATCYVTFKILQNTLIKNSENILSIENKIYIYIISIFFSFPFIYAAQRGSSSIFAALMVSLSALYLKEKKYLKMTIFVAIAATSQFQLIPLTALLFLPKIFKFGKYGIAYITLNYFFVINLTGFRELLSTYKLNKSLFKNVTDYTHDLKSAILNLDNLNSKFPFVYFLIVFLIVSFIVFILRKTKINKGINKGYVESPKFDFIQNIASKIFFLAISSSLLFANPSFDYHLTRLIPAFALLISLNGPRLSSISIASFAITISYLRLWGFLYTKDFAVPIRAICILLISIEVTLNLLNLFKNKQLINSKTYLSKI